MMDITALKEQISNYSAVRKIGTVQEVIGILVTASIPDVRIGELCSLGSHPGTVPAAVIGFRKQNALMMPLGQVQGLKPGSLVESTGQSLKVSCGTQLLGRILDGLGQPIDGGPGFRGNMTAMNVDIPPMNPMKRRRITKTMIT